MLLKKKTGNSVAEKKRLHVAAEIAAAVADVAGAADEPREKKKRLRADAESAAAAAAAGPSRTRSAGVKANQARQQRETEKIKADKATHNKRVAHAKIFQRKKEAEEEQMQKQRLKNHRVKEAEAIRAKEAEAVRQAETIRHAETILSEVGIESEEEIEKEIEKKTEKEIEKIGEEKDITLRDDATLREDAIRQGSSTIYDFFPRKSTREVVAEAEIQARFPRTEEQRLAHIAETKRMTEASNRYQTKKRALENLNEQLWKEEVKRFGVEEARRRRLDELKIQ